MQQKILKNIITLLIFFLLVLFDQWTKHLAIAGLMGQEDIILIPNVLQLHYLENTGAAFSILENRMSLFYILTPILCLVMLYVYFRLPNGKKAHMLQFLLLLILSGAVGNYIDRVVHHYVVDFIYFSLINFPVFNVADIYVTCGVFLLFLLVLFGISEEELKEFSEALTWRKK
jgi:signal peptidase II